MLFIGGGYISFEFAHIAARADSEVIVLNRGSRPLKGFDPDLVDRLVDRSRDLGIAVHGEADVEAIERSETGLRVQACVDGERRVFEADLVVHGAGRVPALDDLALERAGVRAGKGGVEVDRHLRSVSNPTVYAAGDAALAVLGEMSAKLLPGAIGPPVAGTHPTTMSAIVDAPNRAVTTPRTRRLPECVRNLAGSFAPQCFIKSGNLA